jgi:hypothetical protein
LKDFDKSQLKPLMLEILGPVMEDVKGIIRESAKGTFIVATAILMDLNRTNDLMLDQGKGRYIVEDTGLPRITTFRCICVE